MRYDGAKVVVSGDFYFAELWFGDCVLVSWRYQAGDLLGCGGGVDYYGDDMRDGLDSLYPLVDRLRCQYLGRDFSGEMLVTLPTAIMLEAASRIEELEAEVTELRNKILDTGPMLPKRGMTLRYME